MAFFGFLTLGLVIGVIFRTIYKDRGIKLVPSIIAGALASLIGGSIIVFFNLSGAIYYAAISSFLVLFTINTFRKKKPIF